MNGINVKWLDTFIAYFIAAYFVIYNLLSRNINIPQWFQVPFHNHGDKNALNYIYCIKLMGIRKVTNISGFIASKPLSDLTEFFQQVDNKNLFGNIFQETMILFEEWTSFFFPKHMTVYSSELFCPVSALFFVNYINIEDFQSV